MSKGKFEIYQSGHGDWYFRLKSRNGQVICQSEGYKKKVGCLKGVEAIKRIAAGAPVVEV